MPWPGTSVTLGDDHIRLGHQFAQGVERADAVRVRMGEKDALDRRADRLGPGRDPAGRPPIMVSITVTPSSSVTR